MTETTYDFTGLRALFINCTLKRSPEPSNTQGLVDASRTIMERHGVQVDVVRAIDHDIATGVWPDMREHGWETDEWPEIFEQVKAAHILVKIDDGNKAAALTKATEIRARLAAGADFAQVARESSNDPTVSKNNGELGYFEAKTMDPAFAAAAFAMTKPGEISAPVLTSFGYHIILFQGRRPAGIRTFDEVKPELMADLKGKAVAEAKAEATRRIFSDPTLKVDVELIDRINAEAVARSKPGNPKAP